MDDLAKQLTSKIEHVPIDKLLLNDPLFAEKYYLRAKKLKELERQEEQYILSKIWEEEETSVNDTDISSHVNCGEQKYIELGLICDDCQNNIDKGLTPLTINNDQSMNVISSFVGRDIATYMKPFVQYNNVMSELDEHMRLDRMITMYDIQTYALAYCDDRLEINNDLLTISVKVRLDYFESSYKCKKIRVFENECIIKIIDYNNQLIIYNDKWKGGRSLTLHTTKDEKVKDKGVYVFISNRIAMHPFDSNNIKAMINIYKSKLEYNYGLKVVESLYNASKP
jgi:hypothetical protein